MATRECDWASFITMQSATSEKHNLQLLASRHPPPAPSRGMFTGIVEETGVVRRVKSDSRSHQLIVQAAAVARGLKIGDSVAVNGCCLTVVRLAARGRTKLMQFDLLGETWTRTNLQFVTPGALVNLERSLRADGRVDGHFVTGHVDGLGRITRWERVGSDHALDVAAPAGVLRYVVGKGSIALDGISLTVGRVRPKDFRIWIIPHTLKITALRERKVGDAVNLEADILAKYARKLLA
jgi:riboflavin synthase